MAKLEVFWDVGSPYAYLAITQLDGLRERTGAEIERIPFLLGGVFKASGNSAPIEIPPKARYLASDLRRWARDYGVEMKLPGETPFPISTVLPMRVAVAARRVGAGDRYCDAVFRAYWAEGRDVSEPAVLADVCRDVGLDPEQMLQQTQKQDVKDELRAASDQAVARGAFGAPTFFVGDEMYWGNDRLPQIEDHLRRLG